jgi:hypothetical protein
MPVCLPSATVQSATNSLIPSTPSYALRSGQSLNVDMSQTKSGAMMSSSGSPIAMKRS